MRCSFARAALSTAVAVLLVAGCQSSGATASPSASAASLAPTPTPSASPTIGPSPSPTEAIAPSPLPLGYTGLIWNEGECWDMDSGAMVAVADASCDFRLDHILTVVPRNGALISGHGRFDPPSLATCTADAGLLPDLLAPNGGIYLCTKTSQGTYGFIIQRIDAPGAPMTRLILDYWLYK
jgi:hypothetical protein